MPLTVESNAGARKKLVFLVVCTGVTAYFCFLIARPYLNAIMGSAVLAILCQPLYRRLVVFTGGRANWAAALSVLILLVTFIGPAILIWILLQAELSSAYQWLQTDTAAKNGWPAAISVIIAKLAGWIGVHTGVNPDTTRAAALSRINQAGNFFFQKTAVVLGGIGSAVFSLVITLFTLFFMLRSGSIVVRRIALLLPLDSDEIDVLLQKIVASIQGNVLGVIAVGGAQGLLLGLGFWMFGVPSPVLWGLVTAVCSVVPFGGAALVWVPGGIYLMVSHSILKGLMLMAWGAGVVSVSDNIIRPWVLSDRLNMSPLVIFFAFLGGVQLFGFWGIFLGPVVLSLAATFFSMLLDEWQRQQPLDSDRTLPSVREQ